MDVEPTLESLEPIRQTIRRLCIQDQFTWEQSWKSVLSDINQTRRGLLLPDVFQQTLELNDIILTKKALQAVIQQFQLSNGAVQATKFLQWIDLSRPSDHVDPELVFARLPQPYRRIVKVLEHDILDAAWETIQSTSAKYKAETCAVSARSARSSVLLTHASDDCLSLQDDYASAKKRCCRSYRELTPDPLRAAACNAVVMVQVHAEQPYAVLGWQGELNESASLTLQLVNTQNRTSISSIPVDPPVGSANPTSETQAKRILKFATSSELRSRLLSNAEGQSDTLFIAIHICEELLAGETNQVVDHLLLYEFSISTSTRPTSRLLASLVFSEPNEVVRYLTLTTDASLLAVATSKCETTVYNVPALPQTDSTENIQPAALPTLSVVTKLPTDAPATAVYFLYPPVVDTPRRPSPPLATSRPYGIALVAAKSIVKFRLPLADSTISIILAKWPHLTPISSSSIDSTSQFVTVGLVDGLVVVWDMLMDRDYVMLTLPRSTSSLVTDSVDNVFFFGKQFIVALSLQSQRLFFYDITHNAAPTLIRMVTPPPRSNTTSGPSAEPIRFISLSPNSPQLDVPVAMVRYSNGYVMLYDVRNGEAMTSVRVPKEVPSFETSSDVSKMSLVPANSGVLVLTPLPVVFDWTALLTTAFPSLLTVLKDRRLEPTTGNVKRVFIASVDVSANSLFPDGATLSIGEKPSLHSMLLTTAGHAYKPSARDAMMESRSSSNFSQATSNTDSRTSLATTATTVSTSSRPEQELLPELVEYASYPYKPTMAALFERFCEEEVAASGYPGDAKLHRRRNELLKILTSAW